MITPAAIAIVYAIVFIMFIIALYFGTGTRRRRGRGSGNRISDRRGIAAYGVQWANESIDISATGFNANDNPPGVDNFHAVMIDSAAQGFPSYNVNATLPKPPAGGNGAPARA